MKYLKIFDAFNDPIIYNIENKHPFSELYKDDILTHFIDKVDSGDIKIEFYDENKVTNSLWSSWRTKFMSIHNLYNRDNINPDADSIIMSMELKHPYMVRNYSFDYENYAKQILIQYFKRFYNHWNINIFFGLKTIINSGKYFCEVIIIIQDNLHDFRYKQVLRPGEKVRESKESEDIEEVEDYFLELSDHKDDELPIKVEVTRHLVNKSDSGQGRRKLRDLSVKKRIPGYKICIFYDIYDQVYVEKTISVALKRMDPYYDVYYNQISKFGNGYNSKEIPVHGTNRVAYVSDPIWKQTITVAPKNINESSNNESNLIIVDVQPAFKKFFTDNYVQKLKEYAQKYTYVYQIWDNHYQGTNVDKDYLYDKKPDIPNADLYNFGEQDLIEKRYQYDVDVDFYKKILDKETYKDVKYKEDKGLLRRGNYFPTTEGTIIVYIGNRHVWYHTPKKLYELFVKLKGSEVTMVGGSFLECYTDIETTAKSLGVSIKQNHNYIYTATYCPIK